MVRCLKFGQNDWQLPNATNFNHLKVYFWSHQSPAGCNSHLSVSSSSYLPPHMFSPPSWTTPPKTLSKRAEKRAQLAILVHLLGHMAFAGTTQKCMACDKTVYLVDKLTADNRIYHKACFRCHHCKGTLKVNAAFNSTSGSLIYCWFSHCDRTRAYDATMKSTIY